MTLEEQLRGLGERPDDSESWSPRLFDPGDPADAAALDELLQSGRVRGLHDTMDEQLEELSQIRFPRPRQSDERKRFVDEHVQGRPLHRYGRWAWFPWAGQLVHLLPEAEFREVRTSRNVYKITPAEQAQLRALRIGVVGLSVGHATAVTLALEEVGGEYRLADFDRLSLSNMNRLHARVDGIGLRKTVLTAREIFWFNPYARVRLFHDGVNDDNIDAFLTEGGTLDLLFEECDDLLLKVFLRERSRALRIPTIMETSDRGLIDVERFDLEPDRPLLHGLIGDVRAQQLRGLPTADKVPFVLDILGTKTISPRFAASLYEIDRTVRTWPQLASGVALGGALTTDVARRIALGTFRESGRFYVDIESLVCDGTGLSPTPSPPLPTRDTPEPAPAIVGVSRRLDESLARELVRMGTLAPSGGNAQPWRFELDGQHLLLRADTSRESVLDVEARGTLVALGAAATNIELAAGAAGLRARLEPFPEGDDTALACRISFERAASTDRVKAVAQRVTNRRLAPFHRLSSEQVDGLLRAAHEAGGDLQLLTSQDELTELGRVLGQGDRLRMLHDAYGPEAAGEIRWTDAEVLGTRDGLDARTLELSATDLAGLRLMGARTGIELLEAFDLGSTLEEGAHKAFAGASAALLVSVGGTGARRHFEGGRVVESVWLAAESLGLAVQPYTALVYMLYRSQLDDGTFSPPQRARLQALSERLRALFPRSTRRTDVLLLRLSHAPRPEVRSLRRPLEDVLTVRR